jgi:predicted DNA-binding WGR domain protein
MYKRTKGTDAPVRVGSRLELELHDRRRNARRYYCMSVVPLPPGVVLVVVRGRIGRPLVTVRTRFPSMSGLAKKWRELEATRRRHGYRERGDSRQLELFPE